MCYKKNKTRKYIVTYLNKQHKRSHVEATGGTPEEAANKVGRIKSKVLKVLDVQLKVGLRKVGTQYV